MSAGRFQEEFEVEGRNNLPANTRLLDTAIP